MKFITILVIQFFSQINVTSHQFSKQLGALFRQIKKTKFTLPPNNNKTFAGRPSRQPSLSRKSPTIQNEKTRSIHISKNNPSDVKFESNYATVPIVK